MALERDRAVQVGKGFLVGQRPYLRKDALQKIQEPSDFHAEKVKLRLVVHSNLAAVLDEE
ncbi:MAG: hypothetical protein A4E53_00247 [Pelotomaculum sp. PtaB.Bin104]|nr:MAG: hypothetical protein A4E53_00247 [Pelotomaculum sp. PtaB.Bin104]